MSNRVFTMIAGLFVGVLMANSTVQAENPQWNRFHGPDGHGNAGDATLPNTWTDSDYAWCRDLGARDVGSPVVVDGKVYYLVSKPKTNQVVLESLDLNTGKLRWERAYEQSPHHLHSRNTFASSTPAADQDYVFIAFADPQHTWLKCLDHDGNEIWSRDFGSWQSQHGFGTSPRILGSMVLLMNSQQADQLRPGQKPGESRLIAVDRKSGETIWETPLTTTRSCYGVPAVYQNGDTTQIINANTGDGMFALDAKTGKKLWNLNVFDMRVCSTPLIIDDVAIGSSGSGGGGNHLVAVRIPSKPGQRPEQLYRIDRSAPYVPTPAVKDGKLFMVSDNGIASCIDARTGEPIWTGKRLRGGKFGASPIIVGDKVLMISLSGIATILRASDEYEKLGEIDLGGPVGATPAYAEGRLLLRIGDRLCCLGGKSI